MKSIQNRYSLWRAIFLMLFLCVAVSPTSVFAHTGLEKSIPQDKQVVEEIKEIVLDFETKIEKTSTISVKNEKGESVEVSNLQYGEKQMKGEITQPLADGPYTVNWKIVGVDGHPIEGNFSFVVKKPAPVNQSPTTPSGNESATPPPSESGSENQQPAPSNSAQPEQTPANSTHEDEPKQGNNTIILGIIAIVVIALGSIFWMMLKKGK